MIAKKKGNPITVTRIAIVMVMFLLMVFSDVSAQEYKSMRYLLKVGASWALTGTVLDNFWKSGLSLNAGIRIPYCVFCDYNEFWLFGEYNRFPFKNNPRFPIDSFNERSNVVLSGEPVEIYSIHAGAKVFFRNREKRVLPYTYLGYGYLKRTDMVIRSESPLLPYARTGYSDVGAWTWSLGLDVGVADRLRIFWEFTAITGETLPSRTQYNSVSLGILFR